MVVDRETLTEPVASPALENPFLTHEGPIAFTSDAADGYNTSQSLIDREETRLHALEDLDLLNTDPSESFDRITRMASRLFQVPISAISLTDRHRQWFKSHVGAPGPEIPRIGAPCASITVTGESLVLPNLLEDERFSNSPLAQAGIRFYAGAPLTTRDGFVLGSMCVLDVVPRTPSADEVNSLRDLAAMVMAQIELQRDFGRIDPLSGLPNRNQLMEDLEDLERQNSGKERVLLLIDLADPSQFNNMVSVIGTTYVDDLIKTTCRIIKETLGRKNGLYHVGVASFILVLDAAQDQPWQEVVKDLSSRFHAPVMCNEIPVTINAAFGIAPYRLGESAPRDALRTAVSAGRDAREAEIEYAVYSPASDEANRRRFTLLIDIRQAVQAEDQLALVYQPRIDMRTRRCTSAEALLRWQNPRLGNVSPGEFIPLVEQTALARPVTRWVMNSAVEQVARWRNSGLDVCTSINISALNLEEQDFAQNLADALQIHGVPASMIELEFTESALIRNRSRVLGQLADVRAMGVGLAIDDFGTGYSSFSYLQNLPASTVKLDQSFMRGLAGNVRDQMLVRSMIAMSHDLGYHVVAEGVETAEVYNFLAESHCDEVQGYFISRPLPINVFTAWMQDSGNRQTGQRAGA